MESRKRSRAQGLLWQLGWASYLVFPPMHFQILMVMSYSFLAKFSLGPCHASPSRDVRGRSRNPWSKSFLGKFSLGHCHAASPSKDVRGMP